MSSEVLSLPSIQALRKRQLEEQWKREFEQLVVQKERAMNEISMIHRIRKQMETVDSKPMQRKSENTGLYTVWNECGNINGNSSELQISSWTGDEAYDESASKKGEKIDYSVGWIKEKEMPSDEKKKFEKGLLKYYQKREQEYIADVLREVFEECGIAYSNMNDKSKDGNEVQCFQIEENEKIELWVENMKNGEFLMEVVGKTGNPGNESDEEKRVVQEEARRVCNKYADVKSKLQKRGVDIDFRFLSDPSLDPIRFVKENAEWRSVAGTRREMRLDDI